MTTATSTKDNRYVFVDGITDETAEAAFFKGAKVTGTTLNSSSWTLVISAANMAAGARIALVWNTTDQWIDISFDAGVTAHSCMPPSSSFTYDLGQNGRKTSAGLYCRRESSTPGSGFVQANLVF